MIVKRLCDLLLAMAAAVVLAVPVLLVAVLVRLTSPGPALYWSDRVGRHNKLFKMPKFRSMRVGTPAVATHLLAGDMSFVGPRPALFNQHDLIALRTESGVGISP